MNEKYTFEQLQAYLDQELSATDQAALNQDLEKDAALQAELDRHRQTRRLVEQMAVEETRGKVGRIFKQHQQQKNRLGGRSLLRIAASVALILSVGLGYWLSQAGSSPDALADSYLEAFPDRLTTMGGERDVLSDAMQAYNSSDYLGALALFQQVPAGHPQQELIDLYTGIAALETGDHVMAVTNLDPLQSTSDNYSEVAQWYLALTYLKMDEVEKARPLLQSLVTADAYRTSSAHELLEALD